MHFTNNVTIFLQIRFQAFLKSLGATRRDSPELQWQPQRSGSPWNHVYVSLHMELMGSFRAGLQQICSYAAHEISGRMTSLLEEVT
jgi:hypothetical protein